MVVASSMGATTMLRTRAQRSSVLLFLLCFLFCSRIAVGHLGFPNDSTQHGTGWLLGWPYGCERISTGPRFNQGGSGCVVNASCFQSMIKDCTCKGGQLLTGPGAEHVAEGKVADNPVGAAGLPESFGKDGRFRIQFR